MAATASSSPVPATVITSATAPPPPPLHLHNDIVFNESDFTPGPFEGGLPADRKDKPVITPKTMSEKDINNMLAAHRCRIFDSASVLFDRRWLGTDAIEVQLFTSTAEKAAQTAGVFAPKISQFKAVLEPTAHSLRVVGIQNAENDVEPEPMLELAEFCLWCEPNKCNKLSVSERSVVWTDRAQFDALLARDLAIGAKNQKHVLVRLKRIANALAAVSAATGNSARAPTNEKGRIAFEQLERRRRALLEIYKDEALAQVNAIATCALCEQIIFVASQRAGTTTPTAAAAAAAVPVATATSASPVVATAASTSTPVVAATVVPTPAVVAAAAPAKANGKKKGTATPTAAASGSSSETTTPVVATPVVASAVTAAPAAAAAATPTPAKASKGKKGK